MRYIRPHKYTDEELDAAALHDLLNDAVCAEKQSAEGPFYPERGITPESLLAYAAKCREQAARYAKGGAHAAALAKADDQA